MLRLSRLHTAAARAVAAAPPPPPPPSPPPPPPPRVLVLTMVPNGGAVAEALRLLGYNPYTLESTLRKGRALTHPQEWKDILQHRTPFSLELLRVPTTKEKASRWRSLLKSSGLAAPSATKSAAPAPPQYFDSLAGPPATAAFEAILKQCPRSTRVILVEEPDKLAWEKDVDIWLRPLVARCEQSTMWWRDSHLHTMLLGMVDLRRVLIEPATVRHRGTRAAAATSTASAAAQNVPLGQQQSVLRLAGALDLFEQHVKEVVPSDRLLVFRVEDGWEPLCRFLEKPVPHTTRAAAAGQTGVAAPEQAAGSATTTSTTTTAVASASEPLPFPPNTSGSEVLHFISSGLQRSNAIVMVIILAAASLGLLVLASFRDELRRIYDRLRQRVLQRLEPYQQQEQQRPKDEAPTLTVHKMLVLTKRAMQEFGQEYEEEGGAFRSLTGVLRRLRGTPEAAALVPPRSATPSEAAAAAAPADLSRQA